MSNDQPNPYAAPQADLSTSPLGIDPKTMKRMEAVVKDGERIVLVLFLCFVCSCVGFLLLGPWYLMRYFEWRSIAKALPFLLDPEAPPGSFARRFQTARMGILIGMFVGAAVWAVVLVFVLIALANP